MVDVVGDLRRQCAEWVVGQRGEVDDRVETLQLLDASRPADPPGCQVDPAGAGPSTQSAKKPESKPVTSCPAACRIGTMTVPRYPDAR